MSRRHRRPNEVATRAARMTGAGAAGVVGVAAVLGMSPAAHASTPHSTPHKTSHDAAKSSAGRTAHVAPTPTYGLQKIRVGVQLKDGSYAPIPGAPDTLTGDTTFTITETNVDPVTYPDQTFTCTSQDTTQDPGTTRTWCEQPQNGLRPNLRSRYAKAMPRLITRPSPTDAPPQEYLVPRPGDTVTITQTTVQPNLVKDPSTATIQPCVAATVIGGVVPVCLSDPTDLQNSPLLATDEIFEDNGLPPQANNDAADTGFQQPTTVDVLSNDETHGAPIKSVNVSSAPGHGSAHVVMTSSGRQIRYRPDSGFVGTDTFQYTLQTGNGTSTATVTVHVAAPPPTANDDSATAPQNQGVDVDVLANDNTRGQDLTGLHVTTGPGHGAAHVVQTSSGPEIRYVPDNGFTGTDTFKYTIRTAGGTSEATVTVQVDAAPNAVDDTAQTNQDTAVSIPVTGNDQPNGSGPLTIISTSSPGHGSVHIDGRQVVYTPDRSYVGPDTFTYTVQNNGGSDTATVSVTVNGSGNLAETGVDSGALIGIGGVLLGSGAALTLAGRRRRVGDERA